MCVVDYGVEDVGSGKMANQKEGIERQGNVGASVADFLASNDDDPRYEYFLSFLEGVVSYQDKMSAVTLYCKKSQ